MSPLIGRRPLPAVLLLLWLWVPLSVAEPVSLELPNGRLALGDYRAGEAARPAVLLLHGFLQTHHFGIIQSLVDELNDAGYPVLAPTLSLGIDQRRESLPCNAIQNHRLSDGAGELAAWVQWLEARGHSAVVAVGHSSGALRTLLYGEGAREPALAGLVLISMGHFGDWEHPRFAPEERTRAAAGGRALDRYHLSFCDGDYLAPPDAYLSYVEADGARLLTALDRVAVPVALIFGSADHQLPPGWIGEVAATGKRLRLIPGAGHFFSGGYEFELQAALLDALGVLPGAGTVSP